MEHSFPSATRTKSCQNRPPDAEMKKWKNTTQADLKVKTRGGFRRHRLMSHVERNGAQTETLHALKDDSPRCCIFLWKASQHTLKHTHSDEEISCTASGCKVPLHARLQSGLTSSSALLSFPPLFFFFLSWKLFLLSAGRLFVPFPYANIFVSQLHDSPFLFFLHSSS